MEFAPVLGFCSALNLFVTSNSTVVLNGSYKSRHSGL